MEKIHLYTTEDRVGDLTAHVYMGDEFDVQHGAKEYVDENIYTELYVTPDEPTRVVMKYNTVDHSLQIVGRAPEVDFFWYMIERTPRVIYFHVDLVMPSE